MAIPRPSDRQAEFVITATRLGASGVEIEWGDGHLSHFHNIWLRDVCPCEECVVSSGERYLLSTSVAPDLSADEITLAPDGTVEIVWTDAHRTRLDPEWLRAHCYSTEEKAKRRRQPVLWRAELGDALPAFDYESVCNNPRVQLRWAEAVRDLGVALTKGAPVKPGELERFVSHVGCIEETHVGRIYDAVSTPDPAHNANLPVELTPHNDFAAYAWPMGITYQYCLENEAIGGETTLVDGYKIAKLLAAEQPDAFDLLTKTPVPFRVFDKWSDVRAHGRVIGLDDDGEPWVIRYNNHLRLPLDIPGDLVVPYYEAHRVMSALVEDPANRVVFKLEPGDVLAMHNHRVMHGRNAYDPHTGRRHLELGWMNHDHLLSQIRMLKQKVS